jgi:hypothetical protein
MREIRVNITGINRIWMISIWVIMVIVRIMMTIKRVLPPAKPGGANPP